MHAFETLIASLLKRQGFWIAPSYKVDLTKSEKRQIERLSSPRWDIDLLAYKAKTNELRAVECKSFLDSTGVVFRNDSFEPESTYKLFTDATLRSVVLNRLARQLCEEGACSDAPKVTLCLAAGKIATKTDTAAMREHFDSNGWLLLDPTWIREQLTEAAGGGYENDVAVLVAKLLLRESHVA
jgi:hypothetical protein